MSGRGERPAKRLRRLSTDSDDQEDEYDWSDRRERQQHQRQDAVGKGSVAGRAVAGRAVAESNTSRSRRSGGGQIASSATVSRDQQSSPSTHPSLHLTVKVPSSRLKQATGLAPPTRTSGASVAVNRRDHFVGEILQGKRARNVKKSYVVDSDSEEEDDEDEEMEDVGDEDAEGESVEDDEEMDVDEDAEGEDEDAEGEIEMDIPPPPPIIKISRAEKGSKSTIHVKPAGRPDSKTVEAKDSADASDDEELSELDSDIEEEEDGTQVGGEEDAEGEDEEIEVAEEDDDEEEDLDSDDETPAGGSRASTPDLTKLTKRQRARLEEGGSGHLLALPDEVQVKKHLTAEEHAMRRAEMARRRKNLSEKRNEEEKMETINKLLKKQAPKTNARRRDLTVVAAADATPDGESQRPNSLFVRWVSNREGNQICVPDEWIDSPFGTMFVGEGGMKGGKLIEEVQ